MEEEAIVKREDGEGSVFDSREYRSSSSWRGSEKETREELLMRVKEDKTEDDESEARSEGGEKSDEGDESEELDACIFSEAATTRREKDTESSEEGNDPGR